MCLYILVCRVKSLACANFWSNQTCRTRMTNQNVISLVKFCQNLTFTCEINFSKFQKRHNGLIFRIKSLVRANFCPHWTYRIRTTSQNVISEHNLVKFLPLTSLCEVNFVTREFWYEIKDKKSLFILHHIIYHPVYNIPPEYCFSIQHVIYFVLLLW